MSARSSLGWKIVAWLGALALAAHAQVTAKPAIQPTTTATYDVLTNKKVSWTNFFPEPFTPMAVDSEGTLWVVNTLGNTLLRFRDPSGPELVAPTCMSPVSVAVYEPSPDPEERTVFVVCAGTDVLEVHDGPTGVVEAVIQLDSEPADIALDADNGWIFVSCQGSNTVLRLSAGTLQILDRYEIECGERPGFLYLDRGAAADPADNRVFVASAVTGNNTVFFPSFDPDDPGQVLDLDGIVELPDQDVHRIDPFSAQVDPVVREAGSMLFDLARNPLDGNNLWILSTHSRNAEIDNEEEASGAFAINQLVRVPGVNGTSGIVDAPPGGDLDLVSGSYSAARSVNQARSLAIHEAFGIGFAVGPFTDTAAILQSNGTRFSVDIQLPPKANCYAALVYPFDTNLVLFYCLGTMTVEVVHWPTQVTTNSIALGFDFTPEHLRAGREVFLDGQRSKDARFSCASCHPRGLSDQLGWLIRNTPIDFKDVMLTQSLMSIDDSFPHHWRGERDLADFQKAFQGLLGTPPLDTNPPADISEPQGQAMKDFIAFIKSLQGHANPVEHPERVLDDTRGTDQIATTTASDGSVTFQSTAGSAIQGQMLFQTVPLVENDSGFTCAQCHSLETGSNDNLFAEIVGKRPREVELEVPHLRQLQHRGLERVALTPTAIVNESGFGASHNGRFANVFDFVDMVFPTDLNPQERIDVFRFMEQFDQGIAPAAHRAYRYHSASPGVVTMKITRELLQGAHKGWNDVVAFGRYDDGSGLRSMRWWYDRVARLFRPEDSTIPPLTWSQFQAQTSAGKGDHVLVGLPPGNGWRFGIDHDDDGSLNADEIAGGTDPFVFDVDPSDATPPALVGQPSIDFASARLAKVVFHFTEPARYLVTYGASGGTRYTFENEDFVRFDTVALTHQDPSPIGAPISFTMAIRMWDRAGNAAPVTSSLTTFQPDEVQLPVPTVPFLHVQEMQLLSTPTGPNRMHVDLRVRIANNDGAPNFPPMVGETVIAIVAVRRAGMSFSDQSGVDFLPEFTPNVPSINVDGLPYSAIPGPYLLAVTDMNGDAFFQFDQDGLSPGDEVKVSVMAVGQPIAPGDFSSTSFNRFQQLLLEDASCAAATF